MKKFTPSERSVHRGKRKQIVRERYARIDIYIQSLKDDIKEIGLDAVYRRATFSGKPTLAVLRAYHSTFVELGNENKLRQLLFLEEELAA